MSTRVASQDAGNAGDGARSALHGRAEASAAYLEVNRLRWRDLERAFVRGAPPELDELVGWEFRGMNTPFWARIVGIKKFLKGFYRPTGNRAEVYGYNRPVIQDRLAQPWRLKPSDELARPFGFYRVAYVDPTSRDNAYLHSVLLDYSRGMNPSYDPSSGLRDYLVRLTPDNPDVYLGKAYYALGNARVPTSFFVLERYRRGPVDPHFSTT